MKKLNKPEYYKASDKVYYKFHSTIFTTALYIIYDSLQIINEKLILQKNVQLLYPFEIYKPFLNCYKKITEEEWNKLYEKSIK